MQPVFLEHRREKAADVLDHYGLGLNLVDQTQSCREQVALVILAQLLAGHRKGRTRQTPSEQVHAFERPSIEGVHVGRSDIPQRPIERERLGAIGINFDQRFVLKSSLLQTERLTASTSAEFN